MLILYKDKTTVGPGSYDIKVDDKVKRKRKRKIIRVPPSYLSPSGSTNSQQFGSISSKKLKSMI